MISDKIREWCDLTDVDGGACDELRALADRIDAEMVGLPKDAGGEPIHIGDVLYSSGSECRVVSITAKAGEACVGVHTGEGAFLPSVNPKYLSRKSTEPTDSWERIACDIEAAEDWCDQNGRFATGIVSISVSNLSEWSDRIRKLAESGGK